MKTLTLGTSAIRQIDGLYSLNDLHQAAGDEAHKRAAFRHTLHLIRQRLEVLVNLPPEALRPHQIETSARELANKG